jgi:hypothetical protein
MAQWSNRRPGSLVKNVVLDTAVFMRTWNARNPSWPGLRPETGYVDADQIALQNHPCRWGGPYVFERQPRPRSQALSALRPM